MKKIISVIALAIVIAAPTAYAQETRIEPALRVGYESDDNANLYCEVPISFVTAARGGELEVPTLVGRVVLKVPPETQTGKLFRMRGKGVKPVRGGPLGDLLCRVIVETPVKLSGEQKELLRQLEDSLQGNGKHSPQHHSWLDGVKRFFTD